MRIPLSDIARAFPELDRFTPDQRKRFVRAATFHRWQWWVHRLWLAMLTVVLIGLLGWLVKMVVEWVDAHSHLDPNAFLSMSLAGLLLMLVPPLGLALLIRDRLLLHRIRFVLRNRGRCPACQYSLLGIVVHANTIVICPECGVEVHADPALKELTTDEQGRKRFEPSEDLMLLHEHLPPFVQLFRMIDLATVRHQSIPVLLALEAYHNDHQRYPDSLQALVPNDLDTIPLDPWDGQPLKYRLSNDTPIGYVLYSIGDEATDDGGVHEGDRVDPDTVNPDLIFSPEGD